MAANPRFLKLPYAEIALSFNWMIYILWAAIPSMIQVDYASSLYRPIVNMTLLVIVNIQRVKASNQTL